MMPIRVLSMSRINRFRSALGLLLCSLALFFGQIEAEPLPPNGVEELRSLLKTRSSTSYADITAREEPATAEELLQRRQQFQSAVRHLNSLGDVTRALLLTEWRTAGLESSDLRAPLEKIRDAVNKPDEGFQKDVGKLLKDAGEDAGSVSSEIIAEIKRYTRVELEDRLEKDLRYYLKSKLPGERAAAANLIRDAMTSSRQQESSDLRIAGGFEKPGSVVRSRFLRDRLRNLTGEVLAVTRDDNADVQVAGVRALSDMENITVDHVAALKPLLNSDKSSVAVRRATSQALTHMLEVLSGQMDRSRPQPILRGIEHIFPVAVSGLADNDSSVRRECLEACHRAALVVDDLATEQRTSSAVFREFMALVDKSLPALNRSARDEVPEVRVAGCHALEMMVLLSNKVHLRSEQLLPAPDPELPRKTGPPGINPDKKKEATPPAKRSTRRPSTTPTIWASARPADSAMTVLPQGNAAVTLAQRVRLSSGQSPASRRSVGTIHRVSFASQKNDELPPPARVQTGFEGSLEAMIAGVRDRDYRVRLASVDVLETLGETAAPAIPALVNALGDSNKFVRWASARTLGRLAPRRADEVVPGLIRLLNDREDQSVRITAAYALEQYGPAAKAAVAHLARVINRGDKEYIIAILHAIQGIGSDAVPALPNVAWIMRSRDLPSSVRVEAAQTLARFGPLAEKQRADLRYTMMNETDEAVRNAASAALLALEQPKK